MVCVVKRRQVRGWRDNGGMAVDTALVEKLRPIMWLILLEALGALALLLFLVWWTMFSGRKGGEVPPPAQDDDAGGRKN